MKFFHYLFENHPGEGVVQRTSEKTIGLVLPDLAFGEHRYDLPVDYREKRGLVVVDGELLWESIPKAGDVVLSVKIDELMTNAEHLRKPRFGVPSYRVVGEKGRRVAWLKLTRHFLLLPTGNAVFRRFRDKRSLGPMYTFIEMKKDANGPSVVWRNSSY